MTASSLRLLAPLCAALSAVLAFTAAPTQAQAAEPALGYSAGEQPRHLGPWPSGPIYVQADVNRQWRVRAAVAKIRQRTGLDLRVASCPGFPEKVTANCVTVSSDWWSDVGPTGKRLGLVSLWSEGGKLAAADVDLDDKDGKRAGKSKRATKLTSYIARAAGLTQAQAAAAAR